MSPLSTLCKEPEGVRAHHKYTYEELPDSLKAVMKNPEKWEFFKTEADAFLESGKFSYVAPVWFPSFGERLAYCFSIPLEKLPLYINAFNNDFLIDTVKLRLKSNK